MASAVFTVNGGSSAGGVVVSASSTVNLALSSSSGVNTVAWSFIGSHSSGASYPTITNGDTKGLTASFPVGGSAESWLLQCVVNGSLDENGDYDASLTTTSLIGVAISGSTLLFASNETTERSSTHGWMEALNELVTTVAGTAGYIPVGGVFIAVVDTDPNTLLGYGTWSAIGAGRVLVGQDTGDADYDVLEETGGSKSHTHSTPAHKHEMPIGYASAGAEYAIADTATTGSSGITGSGRWSYTTSGSVSLTLYETFVDGSSTSGSTDNPMAYIVVKIWKRTA